VELLPVPGSASRMPRERCCDLRGPGPLPGRTSGRCSGLGELPTHCAFLWWPLACRRVSPRIISRTLPAASATSNGKQLRLSSRSPSLVWGSGRGPSVIPNVNPSLQNV